MPLVETIKNSSLKLKLLLVIVSLVLVILLTYSLFTSGILARTLHEQLGSRALQVSRTVAISPYVIEHIRKGNQFILQTYARQVQEVTGASFVVIGDKNGIRLAHPKKNRIGKRMVGGDNDRALIYGESYISQAKGTLGVSLRGKSAIKNSQNQIIGVVSVGYLLTEINEIVYDYQIKFLWFVVLLLAVGTTLAIAIAQVFKRATFGLEPAQIADLLVQKQATLEAVREGIIAINKEGKITTINQAAIRNLRIKNEHSYIHQSLRDILPNSGLVQVIEKTKSELDAHFVFNSRRFIGNRFPVFEKGILIGAVLSFRPQDELEELYESLSKLQQYSELLRVQTHEYANQLHTIGGLIQLDAKEEALELISRETAGYQALVQFLANTVKSPIIAGMIIGKYNRAKELGVSLHIDRESSIQVIPENINPRDITTIVGNVLDNAFEAAVLNQAQSAKVELSFTDIGNDLVFEVEDNGAGITNEQMKYIFDDNYSTKEEAGHGLGLMIIRDKIQQLGGHISITSESEDQDKKNQTKTVVCVYIPKKQNTN